MATFMAETHTAFYTPRLIVIALLITACALTSTTTDVRVVDEAGLKLVRRDDGSFEPYLPDRLDDWVGVPILYCHNPVCPRCDQATLTAGSNACAVCGKPMYNMTVIEQQLPGDTIFLKKQYQKRGCDPIQVMLVVAGKERASFHRPELCLNAAGYFVESSQLVKIAPSKLRSITIRMLKTYKPLEEQEPLQTYYAYWFVGHRHIAHSDLERMFYMAMDRLFYNIAYRWSYVVVNGLRDKAGDCPEEVHSFIGALHTQIVRE